MYEWVLVPWPVMQVLLLEYWEVIQMKGRQKWQELVGISKVCNKILNNLDWDGDGHGLSSKFQL